MIMQVQRRLVRNLQFSLYAFLSTGVLISKYLVQE